MAALSGADAERVYGALQALEKREDEARGTRTADSGGNIVNLAQDWELESQTQAEPDKHNTDDTYTLRELQDMDVEPPRLVVDGMLSAGLALLAAPPKSGKSWMALQLLDAVSSGSAFLGHTTSAGDCLYIALEDSQARLKKRMNDTWCRFDNAERIRIAHSFPDFQGGFVSSVEQWRQSVGNPVLVIVDTLARIKGANKKNMNAYESDTQVLGAIQQYAIQNGLCILCITHFSKASKYAPTDDIFDRITGTAGGFGCADTTWVLCGARDKQDKTLAITGRDVAMQFYKVAFVAADLQWQLLGEKSEFERKQKINEYKQSNIARTLRALMDEHNGLYECTSGEFNEECYAHTSNYAATSEKAIAVTLRGMADIITEVDGIRIEFPEKPVRRKETIIEDGKRKIDWKSVRIMRFAKLIEPPL